MTEKEIADLLERYLSGQCSTEEQELIDRWFEQRDPAVPATPEKDISRIAGEMLTHIQRGMEPVEKRLPFGRKLLVWGGIAAAAVLVAAMGYLRFNDHTQREMTSEAAAGQLFTFRTQPGQRARLALPDSSVVWLNGNTSVRFDKAFDGKLRELFLDEGEAFFDVQPDPQRPFVVHGDQVQVNVLGTSFNIQLGDHRSEYRISVSTGIVGVSHADGRPVAGKLQAGQQLTYSPGTDDLRIQTVDPADISAWTRNELLFQEASWHEIAHCLSTWYGVDVKLGLGRGKQETFTARFENPSLEAVLKALQRINRFKYHINGKEVFITD